MSNIYFICDNCGIETNGFTFVNGMKFCAKCYHQIFGKDNQQTEIAQLKQQLAEKEKENEELKLKLDIRAMNLQNINTERMEAVRNQTQLAIQELEKLKASADKWFECWENSKYEGNRYDKLDVSNAYLQMSCEIEQKIKELKGEKDDRT